MEVDGLMEWIKSIYEAVISFFSGIARFLLTVREEIWEFLQDPTLLINYIYDWLRYAVYKVINTLIEMLGGVFGFAQNLLPDLSGFEFNTIVYPSLRIWHYVNWLVPFDSLINAVSFIAIASFAWLTVGIITRWIKLT